VRGAVAVAQLDDAQAVALGLQAHRLGIDRDDLAQRQMVGQVALMQLDVHDCRQLASR
jgi:hypothetical protein